MKCYLLIFRWVIVIPILVAVFTIAANAAVYLKIGDIKGESQAVGHEEEIEVVTWSWGVLRPPPEDSTGLTRSRGATEFREMEITKVLDKATVKLIDGSTKGTIFPEAILVIERGDNVGADRKVLEIKMSNVLVTYASLFGSTEASETVHLNFTGVEMIYSDYNSDGSPAGNVTMSFDLVTEAP